MENKLKIIPIFISNEGCGHCCIFCDQEKITGRRGQISPQEVREKVNEYLETLQEKNAIVEIAFYGGSFTGLSKERQQELLEAVQPYLKERRISGLRVSTRPDYIDQERLKLLKAKGVRTIELGVQSMNDEVLMAANRGHTAKHTLDAVKLIKEEGFNLGIQMMVGLPRDTKKTILNTVETICRLRPDFVRIYPVLVLKGTGLERAFWEGSFKPLALEKALEICAKAALRFLHAGIPVIRIGLQTTEEIRPGEQVIAGPFHPAFGELVSGRIYWFLWKKLTDELTEEAKEVEVAINDKDYSKGVGQNRTNFHKLKELRPHCIFRLISCSDVPPFTLRVQKVDGKNQLKVFSLSNLEINN